MNKTTKQLVLNKIVEEMLVKLNEVISDPELKKRPDLFQILNKDIVILTKTKNIDRIAPQLFQEISLKYIEDPNNFPKSLIELYYWARIETNKYDGLAWSTVQSGTVWLEN